MVRKDQILSYPHQWWQKLDATNTGYFSALLWQLGQGSHSDYRDWELASIIPGGSRRLVMGEKTDGYRRITQGHAAFVESQCFEEIDKLLGLQFEYGWVGGGIGRRRGKLAELTPKKMYIDSDAVSLYRREKKKSITAIANVMAETALFASMAVRLPMAVTFGSPQYRMLQ